MRLITVSILVAFTLGVHAQNAELKELRVGTDSGTSIRYHAKCADVVYKTFGELPKSHPMYYSVEGSWDGIVMLKAKTDIRSEKEYFVVYSELPSGDPHYSFWSTSAPSSELFQVPGNKIIIPGNGVIYSEGHANNVINKRQKYIVKNDSLTEITQPYYYAGLKTKTLTEVTLFASEDMKEVVDVLPEGTPAEIILQKKDTYLFLVVTENGITGWVDTGYLGIMPTVFENLFYAGD